MGCGLPSRGDAEFHAAKGDTPYGHCLVKRLSGGVRRRRASHHILLWYNSKQRYFGRVLFVYMKNRPQVVRCDVNWKKKKCGRLLDPKLSPKLAH